MDIETAFLHIQHQIYSLRSHIQKTFLRVLRQNNYEIHNFPSLPNHENADFPQYKDQLYTEFCKNITCESDLIRLVKEKGQEACVCGGEYYGKTTKQKIGRANNLLVDGFWFYNWISSLLRYRKRRRELRKYYIRIK